MPGLLEKNDQFTVGEEEIAAENRQQLLDVLIRLLTDTDLEVRLLWFVCLMTLTYFRSEEWARM